MATWGSTLDVLADLDMLSELSAGCVIAKDIPIVAYSSHQRENIKQYENYSPPQSPTFNMDDELYFLPSQNFGAGIGRGERIMTFTRNRKDEALHRQLRMAMGAGYSNELIEEYIRGDSSSEQSSIPEQFEDLGTTVTSCDAGNSCDKTQSDCPTTGEILLQPSSTLESFVITEDTGTLKTPIKEVKIPKTRRNRNALLNSLPSYKKNINKTEKETLPFQHHNTNLDYVSLSLNNSDNNFQSDDEHQLPSDIDKKNKKSPVLIREIVDFHLREEDFPPL